MIRLTAPRPRVYDLAQLLAEARGAAPGVKAVNEVDPDLIAAYWDDEDAPDAKTWEQVAGAHAPVDDSAGIEATDDPLRAQVAALSARVESLTAQLVESKTIDAAKLETDTDTAAALKELVAKVAEAFGISWEEADKVRQSDPDRWREWLAKLGIEAPK